MIGVYAHLTHYRDGNIDLRLLLDSLHPEINLFPVPIRLGKGSLLDSIHAVLAAARETAARDYPDKLAIIEAADADADVAELMPILALLLYLCADEADYSRPHPPRIVHAQKQGPLMTPPQNVRYWTVGERIGATLRQTDTVTQIPVDPTTTHQRPRPHLRRAHWHGYWVGPKEGDRRFILKWIAPTLINATPDTLIPVIHPIQ
ncbi:MAG: hypothetical protein IPL59_15025 [Candidatus Competibacteraceae bacterium]|nr:hypothetical protein [Candidatus Competibacteraceae bacterium]